MAEPNRMDEPSAVETGDVPAWGPAEEELMRQHLRRIFLLIYRIVGSVPDAQDLAQETFIKALQRREQLRDPAKAGHWLSRIASNTAIDFLRRSGRTSTSQLDEMALQPSTPRESDPEQQVLRGERERLLQRALDCLTERERTALVLRDLEDLPAEEVARRMNCGKATVRSHIANARVKFKRFLEVEHGASRLNPGRVEDQR